MAHVCGEQRQLGLTSTPLRYHRSNASSANVWRLPEASKTDDVEKFLTEQKSLEDRKQALIAELLKQKEAAIRDFDEKLAKLGHQASSTGKSRRSHHKRQSGETSFSKEKSKA